MNKIVRPLLLTYYSPSLLRSDRPEVSRTVQDTLGAAVVGASITGVSSDAKEKTATSNQRGEFTVTALAPGNTQFVLSRRNSLCMKTRKSKFTAGDTQELVVPLTVEGVQEQVDVSSSEGVSTDPQNNAGATVLKEKDLEALPDDPDELEGRVAGARRTFVRTERWTDLHRWFHRRTASA
jgi:hypothetical protein